MSWYGLHFSFFPPAAETLRGHGFAALRGVLPPRVRPTRLTMYGVNLHQRKHHSVAMTGALCPHMGFDLSAFSTLFGASKRVRPPRRRAPRGETPAFKQLIANLNGGFNPPPAEPLRGCPAFLTALDFHFMQTPSRFSDYIFPYPGLYYLRYPTCGQAR